MVNLIKFCNPKSIQISIHMQMYILQLSCHQETLLLDSLNLISISDYSFHFQSISKILSQKFSSNRHTSCMYPLPNPGFFLGNRQYVQFNLLCLECLVQFLQFSTAVNFNNLLFQISKNCSSGGFLVHFLQVISVIFLIIKLYVFSLKLSLMQSSFSRQGIFCFRIPWLGYVKTSWSFTCF